MAKRYPAPTAASVDARVTALHHYRGSGSPEGRVAAPVGANYVDEAATAGAVRWIKTTGTGNTGWQVEYGDTGWRDFRSLLLNGWQADIFQIRRTNDLVTLEFRGLSGAEATSRTMFNVPSGLRPNMPSNVRIPESSTATEPTYLQINRSAEAYVLGSADPIVDSYAAFQAHWLAIPTWPSVLPGTPI